MKFAVTRVIRGFARSTTLEVGHYRQDIEVVQFKRVWTEPPRWTRLWWDVKVLPLFAHLTRERRIELLWHREAAWEFGNLPKRDSPDGPFFGAPLTWVEAPISRGAIQFDGHADYRAHEQDWLDAITEPRFLELRKLVNAERRSHRFLNQLLDALHLWCAEHIKADYFLTTDYKLIHLIRSNRHVSPRVRAVTPLGLFKCLHGSKALGLRDVWRVQAGQLREAIKPTAASSLEELAALGDCLERGGFYDPPTGPSQ